MTSAKAIGELLERSDCRLRSCFSLRRAVLRVRSLYSGIPYSKLKLFHLMGVRLDQILVINRESGVILDEWSEVWGSKKAKEIASREARTVRTLTAINELEKQRLATYSGGLRALNVGNSRVHLCATPTYILAAACGGSGSRKLERPINAALRKSLEATPALYYFTAGKGEELQGTAKQVASNLERLLLAANLTQEGVVPRPIFAYAAIAALSLAGITATGDAILRKYAAAQKDYAALQMDKTDEIKQRVMDIVASTNTFASVIHVDVSAGGRVIRLSGVMPSQSTATALSKNIKDALGNVTVTQQLLFAEPADLLTAQINRSLLQLMPTGGVNVPFAPVPISDDLVESALANLPNFDRGIGAKLDSLKRIDLFARAAEYTTPRAVYTHSDFSQRSPVSVTDQGVRVGLFSTSRDGNSIFSSSESGLTSEVAGTGGVATTSSVQGGVNSGISNATVPSATPTLDKVTATARGLPR